MKKKLYGIYIILLGLRIKYLKKNDQKALMDFMAKVTKYSSMVIFLTLTLGCAFSGVPTLTDEEPKASIDWKGGIPTPTPIAEEVNTETQVIEETNPLNLPTLQIEVDFFRLNTFSSISS